MSSSLLLSGPRARAMVESLLMALRRRATSSCLSSSISTAIGYNASYLALVGGLGGWSYHFFSFERRIYSFIR